MVLGNCRVVELGTGQTLAYAGKLFADFGADVVKIEAPGGDPARREAPLVDTGNGVMQGALFAWLNTNKSSLVADLSQEDPAPALLDAIRTCDVLLDAREPRVIADGVLPHARIRELNPEATIVSVSWFGATGPYRDFEGSDVVCRALAGVIAPVGPVERPMTLSDHQADIVAAVTCFTAGLTGLMTKERGKSFSVSSLEACIVLAEWHYAQSDPAMGRRCGVNRFPNTYPVGIFPAREGWIGIGVSTVPQWREFCDLFGIPDADNPRYATGADRARLADEIDSLYVPQLKNRTASEWFEEALKRRLPFAVVPEMSDLLDPAGSFASAFAEVRIGNAAFRAPTLPIRLPMSDQLRNGAAPLLGESAPERVSPPIRGFSRYGGPAGPLEGLRIVDLSMGWAGPLVTRQIADLGAQVIKVEACGYADWWRGNDIRPVFFEEKRYEKNPGFTALNRNKIDVTLDLTHPDGVALLKRLVRGADVVVENYARDVLPKLKLDYPVLRAEKRDLVMLSMAAFPQGMCDAARAYGYTLEQASGLPLVAGDATTGPMLIHYAYGDPIAGLNGMAALLLALLHRDQTGQGQHVDLAQVECLFPHLAPWAIECGVTGKTAGRVGNRHPHHSPSGVYRCDGADAWVFISVLDDAMWKRLCETVERSDWRDDPSMQDHEQRDRQAERIEKAISAWTSRRSPQDAMEVLQANRVATGVVRSPFHIKDDPHLRARHFWQTAQHPFAGSFTHSSLPIQEGQQHYVLKRVAPTLGQDNDFVLGELLGLSPVEIADLAARGIIGTEARPPAPRRKLASA
ncbi:CoA transferase [Xanthobacter sp. DSM 24535]|uniref:CaiB/BaiF CoA-transferase family protein n=1 Tax=Roseixanthobacter psychrophilus TaxID=3119917 RepID=UPI003726E108